MPYNNEYNRKLARDIDFINRQYIANCDNTGQGTQNYRVQISSYSGGGKGSKEYKCHYDSNSESDEEEHHHKRKRGGAILGFQAGTILGGPKGEDELPTRKQISSTSSLGVPLQTNNQTIDETNDKSTPDVKAAPAGAEGASGGAILGMKPTRFGTTPIKHKSYLTTAVIPENGRMYRAGRFVSVRDLGEDDVQYSRKGPSHYESDSSYDSSSESDSSGDEHE